MLKKMTPIAVAIFAVAFASATRSHAGVEMMEPEIVPAPRYSYVPPPPPTVIYYAPPPSGVVIERGYAHYPPRYRAHRHHRFHGPRGHWRRGYHRR